jgi:hypothetical protein
MSARAIMVLGTSSHVGKSLMTVFGSALDLNAIFGMVGLPLRGDRTDWRLS